MKKQQQYVLVEKTSKSIKKKQALSEALIILGAINAFTPIGATMIGIGLVILFIATIERWWHHG